MHAAHLRKLNLSFFCAHVCREAERVMWEMEAQGIQAGEEVMRLFLNSGERVPAFGTRMPQY
jgi:hypothetical protein